MSEPRPVSITGLSVLTALGRGPEAQLAGSPAFSEVRRFDTSNRRVHHAATVADVGTLEEELDLAIATACGQAGADRRTTPLLLALHSAPTFDFGQRRVYTSACVSASTAIADAATLIRSGRADRIVVAAGYLVEPDQYALFDAGRALADDHAVRPFSLNRRGLLLGDGVAAVVLEAGDGLAEIVGWGRAGDAYHPCQPSPDGRGLATAIRTALTRAGLSPDLIGYINANATGTTFSDAAEAAAITTVFGRPFDGSTSQMAGSTPGFTVENPQAHGSTHQMVNGEASGRGSGQGLEAGQGLGAGPVGSVGSGAVAGRSATGVAVSSSKGVHGHALEASGLVELVVTVQALRGGKLPVNAGFLEPDPDCPLDLILDAPRPAQSPYGMSLNSAFGGANTALVVRAG
ncbi:beta-ketoacyl-[acyl-carrier-protein] synthase family protein [Kribbella sp. CA-247076]|uniref:beta-ketoacyl-[acyl-carrier-protein] synthase family protein n=1 Tax=Kribbella sp. CA-247076 TaxID=3239941 RepID=UPI003D8B601C